MEVSDVRLQPGCYVVAVSGGVDSMVLLDALRQLPGVELIVAHFDHGIRPDSHLDRQLVERIAAKHGLSYIYEEGRLGPGASEARARAARYDFLRRVRAQTKAQAIVTAHHQDDLIETAIINMVRGTGPRGLSSLRWTHDILRPFVKLDKSQIRTYAQAHNLAWREDSTNESDVYLRNHIRHHVVPRMTAAQRTKLLEHTRIAALQRIETEGIVAQLLAAHAPKNVMQRRWFTLLPHAVAREVMAQWLRLYAVHDLTRQLIERLVRDAKVLAPGKRSDIDKTHVLHITKHNLEIITR